MRQAHLYKPKFRGLTNFMIKTNKIYGDGQKTSYTLGYHLAKVDNLRLRTKVRKMVEILPQRYDCEVKFSKRRIWFLRAGEKFIQVVVEKQQLFLKIKTKKGWITTEWPDWEDFRRLYFIFENY